jgi:hypothetical protein
MSTTAVDDQLSSDDTLISVTGSNNSGGWGAGNGQIYTTVPLGAGAIGATGSFSIPSGTLSIGSNSPQWSSISSGSTSMTTSSLSIMAEGDGDALIKTKKNTINLDEMAVMMETVKERLLILAPNFELQEKYPALKEAYEHYKVLEAMMTADDK